MLRYGFQGAGALLCVLALTITGCTGKEDAESGSPPPGGTHSEINPHPVSDLKDGGDLRVPLSVLPEQWNQGETDGPLAATSAVEQTILPSVFTFDAEGHERLDENYVSEAEVTSTDPQVLHYRINDKARWSNGEPFSWRDFQAAWKATNGSDPNYQIASSNGYRNIASVERGDTDLDVIVTFSKPYGEWHTLFTPLLPASTIDTPEKFNHGWVKKLPATAGPFTLVEKDIDEQAQTVTVRRDENWWGARAPLDTVTFRVLEGNADVDAYLNNELDVVSTGTTQVYPRVKDAPNTDFRVSQSAQFGHITFGARGVFSDQATRVAISKAIDRSAIVKTLYSGLPVTVTPLGNHLFLQSDPDYEDHGDGATFDTDQAAKELDAAGWELNGDTRTREGKVLEAELVIPTQTPSSQQIAEIVQAQLAVVGAKVKITAVPSSSFFPDYVTPGGFDLAVFSWVGTGFKLDAASIYEDGEDTQNSGKVTVPGAQEIFDKAEATLDDAERSKLLNEADAKIWEAGHSVPIAQSPRVIATRPTLANYGAVASNGRADWTTVGWLTE